MKQNKKTLIIIFSLIIVIILFILFIDFIFPTPIVDEILVEKGNQGKVKIIEYANFQCDYCKLSHKEVKHMLTVYKDKVDYDFRHYPTSDSSLEAAIASECAGLQGKFYEYSDLLFNLETYNLGKYLDIAEITELNMDEFNNCILDGNRSTIVEKDIYSAVENGIIGTPTFFINGNKIEGVITFDKFKGIIEAYT